MDVIVMQNIIPNNGQWETGVPPVMGAHLMASGTVAPISTSKGPGVDVTPHIFQYPAAHDAQVIIYATSKNAANGLAKSVAEAAAAAIKEKGSFTLVLSGELLSAAVCLEAYLSENLAAAVSVCDCIACGALIVYTVCYGKERLFLLTMRKDNDSPAWLCRRWQLD